MSCEMRVRNKISPIQMKSGKAVSVQLLDDPQIVVAIASPAGRLENNCIAIQATPESVSPIHTPLPKMRNSETTRRIEIPISLMMYFYSLCSDSDDVDCTRLPRISMTISSMKAMAKIVVPIAIESCGIHSGVASLPVEISWNCQL